MENLISSKDRYWIKAMEWCRRYCGCHQMPERSFFVRGYQFPLCARCTGIFAGHMAGFVLAHFIYSPWILLCMIPMAVDGTVQYFSNYESTNRRRFITGFLYGLAFMSSAVKAVRWCLALLKSK